MPRNFEVDVRGGCSRVCLPDQVVATLGLLAEITRGIFRHSELPDAPVGLKLYRKRPLSSMA